MNNLSLPLKLILILLWSITSYFVGSMLVEEADTQLGIFMLLVFAGLWMTEIIPLSVSAILVPVVAALSHVLTLKIGMSNFSASIIYLFMGGFTLAALLNKHGIDRWLASSVTQFTNGNLWLTVILFLAVVSLLSMWMSNTSTTAMMLPIAIGLIEKKYIRMRAFVILGTAYAANIGGLATIVGSPPNGIAAAALNIDFFTWLKVGLPATILMFPAVLFALWVVIRPEKEAQVVHLSAKEPMQWTPEAKGSIALFLFTVICWVFAKPIGDFLQVDSFDRLIALLITAAAPALKLISWKELEHKIDWGILLLFGGGLCLSMVLKETGTSVWMAENLLAGLEHAPSWLLILSCIAFMIFLTELASNTGSAAILIPIMIALADQFNPAITYSLVFGVGVGVAATCAFMLPVATPPNALAYATGEVKQSQMLRAGMILNIIGIFTVYLSVTAFS
ncbi:SLC13/DASS family transporter [Shewanella sp. VB17]|uniref:SLC13 family permease n=1 Tax=Shewanella sp. VB17 TaxID=2739432 RepID=UPI00156598C4|nr:SLC13 family permease [Shewanella sp. VB17]NRD74332.1 SLC13/DASS family transporter [Shewanella sp. VB17]